MIILSCYSRYEAAKMLVQLERIHCNLLSELLKPLGLFTSQHRILMYLADRGEDHPSQKEIAKTFDISPAAVAVSLRKLAHNGFIEKKCLDNDNRVNNVALTEKGMRIVSVTMDEVKRMSESLFSTLSDEQLDDFCNCIIKISSVINKIDMQKR